MRDDTGALVDFNRTHRFRHTVATNLLNGGVPLHVLQRYLGHLAPTMSMTAVATTEGYASRRGGAQGELLADGELLLVHRPLSGALPQTGRHSDRRPATGRDV